jgi:tetratricopeptide (TPR) repeat protein
MYVPLGKWDAAIADLSKAAQLEPDNAGWWAWLAPARLGAGRPDEYRKDFAEMLQRFGQTDKPFDAYLVAATCAVGPDATADWPTVVGLAEKAAHADPASWEYLHVLGAVLYRAGQLEEAVRRLAQADQLVADDLAKGRSAPPPACPWFFLAMAHHRLDHVEESKKWLDKAVVWTDKTVREYEQGIQHLPWIAVLKLKLFRAEAEALIGTAAKPKPETGRSEKAK